jgi:hypothetical protein
MPAKKTVLTEEQRAKNIREAAEKIGASNDPKVLDSALKKIVSPIGRPSQSAR